MYDHSMNISPLSPLLSVESVKQSLALPAQLAAQINSQREEIAQILAGNSDKLLVIAGPCSIHDTDAAIEYGQKLQQLSAKHQDNLLIVMRAYLEKPRTISGWKGFINDPYLDGSYHFNDGITRARQLLLTLNNIGLPCATELLTQAYCPYLIDLLSWVSIGARTVESQPHRELASGLPCPVGFKNTTDGNVQVAINAALCAKQSHVIHHQLADQGMFSSQTQGNGCSHIVLRGGTKPNYQSINISNACNLLVANELPPNVIVDCSHGNSEKKHSNQKVVANELARQLASGSRQISGVMLESFLVAGKQAIAPLHQLTYGQSITDACIDFTETEEIIASLSQAIVARRRQELAATQLKQSIRA